MCIWKPKWPGGLNTLKRSVWPQVKLWRFREVMWVDPKTHSFTYLL